jgi:hypothetical protein
VATALPPVSRILVHEDKIRSVRATNPTRLPP